MGKSKKKNSFSLIFASGAVLMTTLGSVLLIPEVNYWLEDKTGLSLDVLNLRLSSIPEVTEDGPSRVLPLAYLEAEEREAQLQAIASEQERSLDRNRARYLLASDLIRKYEGGLALRTLARLERDYPVLAPYILLKRGRAYELTNENDQAQATWEKLIATYPDSPVVGEALYMLGKHNSKYWDQAIAEYPEHPRTQEIIRQRLEENPDQFDLLLLLAKHQHSIQTNQIRDRLVLEYSSKLTSRDWEVIGDGYWQYGEYRKAVDAYKYAPSNPSNIYRAGRGLHINGNYREARSMYTKLVDEYPDAEQTGLALKHQGNLSGGKVAIYYLDIIIEKFPSEAPDALLRKAKILDAMNSPQSASTAINQLLTEYPNSEAAAKYRWRMAEKLAARGNLTEAVKWLEPILTNTNYSSITPKAAFWLGKWAQQLNRQEDANKAFEYVLTHHWQSYYAWRSAVMLNKNVGNFQTVRQMTPNVIKPSTYPLPPAGSQMFKELYLLGEFGDARRLFRAEIGDRQELSVREEFTEALLTQIQGKYQQAINQIWRLNKREEPRDRREWQALRKTDEYWHALFPFPYYESILAWSQKREVNPILVISLIRQESSFELEARSPVGATGLMQIMPSTGEWVADLIDLNEYSLTHPEDNINLGTWYLNHTHDQYQDNSMLAVASYNAGPGNVNKWVRRYRYNDLDVFVENIPFPETKNYVESVFSNYWNYLRIYNPEISQLVNQYNHSHITANADVNDHPPSQ